MISGLFIGSNDGRPPQAYKKNIVSLSLIEPFHDKSVFLKTKGANQPNGNHAAHKLLCLCYIDSTMAVLQKKRNFQPLVILKINHLIQGGGG